MHKAKGVYVNTQYMFVCLWGKGLDKKCVEGGEPASCLNLFDFSQSQVTGDIFTANLSDGGPSSQFPYNQSKSGQPRSHKTIAIPKASTAKLAMELPLTWSLV